MNQDTKTLSDQLLALVGLAREERRRAAHEHATGLANELISANASILQLKQELRNANARIGAISQERAENNKRMRCEELQRAWCLPELAAFPVNTPIAFYDHTLDLLKTFMANHGSVFDVSLPSNFRSPQHWALYWCLAHASNAALFASRAAKDENGCSREFVEALKSHAQKLPDLLPECRLQISYNSIFEQVEPAMKEAAVGADILLIIGGETVIPNGFARLFWLQGKKSKGGDFALHYDQKNNDGLQVDALANVHRPEQGSFGLYTLYSKNLSFVPSVKVGALPRPALTANLTNISTRLPELIVSSTFEKAGSFADTKAILTYLDQVSNKKPLYVVTVTDGGREYGHAYAPDRLLSAVSDHYYEKLGLKRTQDRTRDRDRGFER